jgi:hypothetical protein
VLAAQEVSAHLLLLEQLYLDQAMGALSGAIDPRRVNPRLGADGREGRLRGLGRERFPFRGRAGGLCGG